jgi:uncharacterized membrane protein YciS (DUF1049 family)
MTHQDWILIFTGLIANVFIIGGGYVKVKTALTRIETDLKWIKRSCPNCDEKK